MTLEVEVLKILVTMTAAAATVAALTYSYVWIKTHPKTWTLLGMNLLLWSVAAMLWSQRVVLLYVDTITTPAVADMRSAFLIITLIGYAFFMLGTYKSGPLPCKWNNRKK